MPRNMFTNELIKHQDKNVLEKASILSKVFDVSEQAAAYRMKEIRNSLNSENECLFEYNS